MWLKTSKALNDIKVKSDLGGGGYTHLQDMCVSPPLPSSIHIIKLFSELCEWHTDKLLCLINIEEERKNKLLNTNAI